MLSRTQTGVEMRCTKKQVWDGNSSIKALQYAKDTAMFTRWWKKCRIVAALLVLANSDCPFCQPINKRLHPPCQSQLHIPVFVYARGRTLWPKHTLYPKLPIRLGLEQTCVFKCQPGEIRFSDPKNTFPCIFSRQVSLPPPPPISFSALGRVPHFWTMHPLMDVCPGSFPPSTFCMIGLELSWNTWCLSPNPEVLSSSCDVAHLEGCIKSIFHKKHRKIHC